MGDAPPVQTVRGTPLCCISYVVPMRVLWVAALIILVDQATKLTVLQTMYRGQSIPLVGDWLRFTFTENPGMAFGIEVGPPGMITVFAMIVTGLIVYYVYQIRASYFPYRLSLAFILGGALGNIIDRVFYGVMLDYSGYFRGHVVDFIHVDIWRGHLPEVLPLIGGSYTALFPIWNVADMAIVAGVVGILLFQNRFHEELTEAAAEAEPPEQADPRGARFATNETAPDDAVINPADADDVALQGNGKQNTTSGKGEPKGDDASDTEASAPMGPTPPTTADADAEDASRPSAKE